MLNTETYEGPIEVRTELHRMEVYFTGSFIRFATLEQCYKDGMPFGVGDMRQYQASFADLPATFTVDVNGTPTPVSGQTILNALEAVAKAAIAATP